MNTEIKEASPATAPIEDAVSIGLPPHLAANFEKANRQIQEAVERIFKVKVQQVRTMNVPGKMRRRGRYFGYRPDWKKAYVTLREGEKMIEYGESL